jgi:uracil-DNA glycosylase family 4
MFTGDGSGDFLFPVLHEAGFASHPNAVTREDGMKLSNLWISAVVRCAPPGNKPTLDEQRNCAPWLDEEIRLLPNLRVVVCLGKIAFDGFLAHQLRAGKLNSRAKFIFGHAAEFVLPGGLTLIASYHPSLQNTNTGKLTHAMLLGVFNRARELASSQCVNHPGLSATEGKK